MCENVLKVIVAVSLMSLLILFGSAVNTCEVRIFDTCPYVYIICTYK